MRRALTKQEVDQIKEMKSSIEASTKSILNSKEESSERERAIKKRVLEGLGKILRGEEIQFDHHKFVLHYTEENYPKMYKLINEKCDVVLTVRFSDPDSCSPDPVDDNGEFKPRFRR